jgi:hypothetical protein
MKFVDNKTIKAFLDGLTAAFKEEGKLYLIGESSLVYEGWQHWVDKLELCIHNNKSGQEKLNIALQKIAGQLDIELLIESPAEIIPLPAGFESRAIKIDYTPQGTGRESLLQFFHFDPYSVSLRFIARGDETDYKLVINYLKNGWIYLNKMGSVMEELLPAFSFETIHQDPAEFRRKWKGLLQMWNAYNKGKQS